MTKTAPINLALDALKEDAQRRIKQQKLASHDGYKIINITPFCTFVHILEHQEIQHCFSGGNACLGLPKSSPNLPLSHAGGKPRP